MLIVDPTWNKAEHVYQSYAAGMGGQWTRGLRARGPGGQAYLQYADHTQFSNKDLQCPLE